MFLNLELLYDSIASWSPDLCHDATCVQRRKPLEMIQKRLLLAKDELKMLDLVSHALETLQLQQFIFIDFQQFQARKKHEAVLIRDCY